MQAYLAGLLSRQRLFSFARHAEVPERNSLAYILDRDFTDDGQVQAAIIRDPTIQQHLQRDWFTKSRFSLYYLHLTTRHHNSVDRTTVAGHCMNRPGHTRQNCRTMWHACDSALCNCSTPGIFYHDACTARDDNSVRAMATSDEGFIAGSSRYCKRSDRSI